MAEDYLHNHSEFPQLLKIISEEKGILTQLIEKDYWLMHVLYGLKNQGFEFELKGGTSLSKGLKIIDRFSEDIDIFIKPPMDINVEADPKKTKTKHIQSRKDYYNYLAKQIEIVGIVKVERDFAFDNLRTYNSGGIRLIYKSTTGNVQGLKDGILLEVGFDTVTPNSPVAISSWALDKALSTSGISIIDNKAIDIPCYHPGYTFVEKLQTIATKYRKEQETGTELPNLMRQYYDVFCLLGNKVVNDFIGTAAYQTHKSHRFPIVDLETPMKSNEAFLLSNSHIRDKFKKRFKDTAALYYHDQPNFEAVIARIHENLHRL